MKLKKTHLLKATKQKLNELGYLYVKDSLSGAEGLYIKLIRKEYFLTLGLTISNRYDSRFTASFYLSKTTRWGATWGDIPNESYKRIGHFLTREERKVLLDEVHNKEGVTDAWWTGVDEVTITHFINTIRIAEKRFVEQPDLFKEIDSSLEVKKMAEYATTVIDKIASGTVNDHTYKFIPQKSIDDIPMEWFKAAEIVLAERSEMLNENLVKVLAADAWHQMIILRSSALN